LRSTAFVEGNRYAAHAPLTFYRTPPAVSSRTPPRVAVVGAGPAGLAAAHDLALLGYAVTVFEAADQPGGMMRFGIPEYRLPRSLLSAEIDRILALGVELRLSTPLTPVFGLREPKWRCRRGGILSGWWGILRSHIRCADRPSSPLRPGVFEPARRRKSPSLTPPPAKDLSGS
jgi:hypothetical protein